VTQEMIQPLNDRVCVKNVYISGDSKLVVPEIFKKTSCFGRVIAVGPGNEHTVMAVQVDDIIAYSPQNAVELELPVRRKFRFMRMGEIICIIDKETAGIVIEETDVPID